MNNLLSYRRSRASENPTASRHVASSGGLTIFALMILLAATLAFALYYSASPAYADGPADDDVAFYAVLHEDGSLVFQTEASDAEGDVNYAGSLKSYGSEKRVPWRKAASRVTSISFDESFRAIKPPSPEYWFHGMSHARVIDVTNLDTSQATSLRSLFENCTSLVEIKGIEGLNTSSCTYMGSMFHNCTSLKSLDLRNFDATKVTVMCYLFRRCSSLERLDVSGPGWHTSALLGAVNAFEGCSSIKRIDLSSWDTSKMTAFPHGFTDCTSLEYIDLSGADFSLMHSLTELFDGCDNLKTVKVSDKVSFSGNGTERLCSLPDGYWLSSADGRVYASSDIPDNVATTYTRFEESAQPQQSGGTDEAADNEITPKLEDSTTENNTIQDNSTVVKNGATYMVVTQSTVILSKAPATKKSFTIPATVKVNGKSCAIVGIAKGAFKNTKVKTLTIKAKKLAKNKVRGCFKGASKLTTVKVPKGKAAAYRTLFTKKTSGKKVTIK